MLDQTKNHRDAALLVSTLALAATLWLVLLAGLATSPLASSPLQPSNCTTMVSSDVTVPTTWTLAASPFCVQTEIEVASGITLTVEAGATVYFGTTDSGLTVNGSLVAVGVPTNPITFTSYQTPAQPGDWRGIYTLSGGHTRLDYCDVGYAGFAEAGGLALSYCEEGSYGQMDAAGVWVEHYGPAAFPKVEIRHSRIHDNLGDGLHFYLTDCAGCYFNPLGWDATVEDTQLDHNTGVAICEDRGYEDRLDEMPTYRNLTLTGNGTDALVFPEGVNLNGDRTFDGPGSFNGRPIRSLWSSIRVQSGRTLTISPGTTLQFIDSSLSSQGTLVAEGTPTEPITFTSGAATPQIGDWPGISVAAYLGGPATLAYCDISYADRGIDTDSNDVTIERCRIHHNRVGIAPFYASPVLVGNSIYDNSECGLCKDGELVMDARYTWWGHPSGPHHPALNPLGLGNRVSDLVKFIPWNTVAASLPPTVEARMPMPGANLTGLPLQFQIHADDPDETEALYFRVEIYSGYARVRDYDQRADPTGWDRAVYWPEAGEGVTATLTLPEALPSPSGYTWQASVSDGWHTVTTPRQPFQVSLSGWNVAGAVPAEPLAVPNTAQVVSLYGMGFTPGAQVWLEQARIGGEVERLDPLAVEVVSGGQIDIQVDLTGRSGPWEVVVSQGAETRQTRLYVLPYLALTSLDYQNTEDLVMNHITPHYLHLTNHGTAAGVSVVGIHVPTYTLVLPDLLDPNRVEYLGEVAADVHLFAVPLDAQESQDVAVYFQLPQSAVNLPHQPPDPNKYDWGDPLRFRFWVLAQPIAEGWQVLLDETANLEELANGAIWGSALIEGWAIDQYAELGDEAAAGEYVERLGSRYPFVADALVMRQLQELQLAASLALDVEDVPPASTSLADGNTSLAPENEEFREWIERQIGDPWSFTKGFLTQADENGMPWSHSQMYYERGTFLVAEAEGLIEGLTFGLYRPPLGYWNYYHINGNEKGLIEIGRPMGNVLSIPLGAKLPGEISKGGISLVRRAANGLRPGGDRYWSIFKLTVEGNTQEPARLGLSVLWKGGDDLPSLWKGRDYNLIHWGDNPSFGGSHWGIGWMSEPVIINDVVQTGKYGEILYKSGTHIYTNHAFIPYRWGGAPFGQVDIGLLRGEINLMHQVPAAAWRAGMLEESLLYPAEYVDDTACGDGSQWLMASWDPNDIEGLPHRTHIWPTQRLEFLIRFENVATATLPAETVTVTLPLHPNLDWDSMQFQGASHPEVLSAKASGADRTLVWTFDSINLPPNQNPPEGEGWVRLRVAPNATLTTGQQITSQATILFDENEPIQTNVVTYTIDLDPPLPALSLEGLVGPWPLVRLTAIDNADGAGVGNVGLFYSPDDVNWFAGPVLTNTVVTEIFSGVVVFTAPSGHYWLRAAAADLTGNVSLLSDESIEIELDLPYILYLPLVRRGQ